MPVEEEEEEKKKTKKKKKKNDSKSGVMVNDPSIRLFGAKISVVKIDAPSSSLNVPSETRKKEGEQGVSSREDHVSICQEGNWYHKKKGASDNMDGANQKPDESSGAECSSGSQDKAATLPLPCPRCNSTKTKFCYFNNYNVNQPRHFCKNCHRYWTAGGKVRNVSGRKSKTSCPQNQSASASCDGRPPSEIGVGPADQTQLRSNKPSAKSQPELMTNGDCPLFESVLTSPALQDTKNSVDTAKVDSLEGISLSSPSLVFADNEVSENAHVERSEASETAAVEWARISAIGPCGTNPKALPILQGFPHPPWVYPYEIGWKAMACGSNGGGQDIAASNSSAMIFPRVCAPNSVSPLVHPSHWGSDTGIRTLQSNSNLPREPSASNGSSSAHSSHSLGKHSRDVSSFNEENAEKLSVLKTPKENQKQIYTTPQ